MGLPQKLRRFVDGAITRTDAWNTVFAKPFGLDIPTWIVNKIPSALIMGLGLFTGTGMVVSLTSAAVMFVAYEVHRRVRGTEGSPQAKPISGTAARSGVASEDAIDPQAARDLLLLLNFSVDQCSLLLLDHLISLIHGIAPTDTGTMNETVHKEEMRFVANVSGAFATMPRRMDLAAAIGGAEAEAETEIRNLPRGSFPNEVDILELRKWMISRFQRNRVLAFLFHEKSQKEMELRHQRNELLQGLALRSKSPPSL